MSLMLHHVAIRTADLDQSVRFYRDALGLGAEFRWRHPPLIEQAAFLPIGEGTWLELFGGATAASESAAQETAPGIAHLALACDDVDEAFRRAVEHGGIPLQEPVTRTLYGERKLEARMAFVAGPSGEVIELYRNDELS